MKLHKVADHRKNCPEDWADDAYFMSLHDTEAMWLSFTPESGPCAVLVGAGGVNALSGQKLGTKLEKDNYLVCPPQPWLDGWKDVDGTVHQFIATPHRKGDGLTVGEQIIGKDSKTGAMGLAVFYPKDGAKLKAPSYPNQGIADSAGSSTMDWGGPVGGLKAMNMCLASASLGPFSGKKAALGPVMRSARPHVEMGLGKGGKIIQKVYGDPHGIEVWRDKPTVVFAFYLVDAKTAAEITGEIVAAPAVYSGYQGPWFGLQDEQLPDVLGTGIFSGLKSAAFTGDISNVENAEAEEQVPVPSKTGA